MEGVMPCPTAQPLHKWAVGHSAQKSPKSIKLLALEVLQRSSKKLAVEAVANAAQHMCSPTEEVLPKPCPGLPKDSWARICEEGVVISVSAQLPNTAREEESGQSTGSASIADRVDIQTMREFPHLAPCHSQANGHWVYRGQSCVVCTFRVSCGAWPEGETFSMKLPKGLPPLSRKNRQW